MDESKTGQSIPVSTTPAEPAATPVQQPTVGVSVGREQGPVAAVPAVEVTRSGEHAEMNIPTEVAAAGVQEVKPDVPDLTMVDKGHMTLSPHAAPANTAPAGIISMSLPQAEAQLKTVSDTASPLRYKFIAGIRQIKRRLLRPAA